jgi:predicted transcriptional regulator
MARPKKEGKAVSLLMDKALYDRLERYCETSYLSKTAAIEKALDQMFRREDMPDKAEAVGSCGDAITSRRKT